MGFYICDVPQVNDEFKEYEEKNPTLKNLSSWNSKPTQDSIICL